MDGIKYTELVDVFKEVIESEISKGAQLSKLLQIGSNWFGLEKLASLKSYNHAGKKKVQCKQCFRNNYYKEDCNSAGSSQFFLHLQCGYCSAEMVVKRGAFSQFPTPRFETDEIEDDLNCVDAKELTSPGKMEQTRENFALKQSPGDLGQELEDISKSLQHLSAQLKQEQTECLLSSFEIQGYSPWNLLYRSRLYYELRDFKRSLDCCQTALQHISSQIDKEQAEELGVSVAMLTLQSELLKCKCNSLAALSNADQAKVWHDKYRQCKQIKMELGAYNDVDESNQKDMLSKMANSNRMGVNSTRESNNNSGRLDEQLLHKIEVEFAAADAGLPHTVQLSIFIRRAFKWNQGTECPNTLMKRWVVDPYSATMLISASLFNGNRSPLVNLLDCCLFFLLNPYHRSCTPVLDQWLMLVELGNGLAGVKDEFWSLALNCFDQARQILVENKSLDYIDQSTCLDIAFARDKMTDLLKSRNK